MLLGRILPGAVLFTTLLPFPACGVTTRDDQPDSSYVALGNSPDFDAVGLFVGGLYTGSGVLIAPTWVLTAAHNLILTTSATFTIGGTAYTSTELIKNPDWNGDAMNGYDFGLMRLATPVTNVTPALLYTESLQPVMEATFVGLGFTGTGLTGYQTLDGLKRAFNNVIDGDFGNPARVLGADFDNPHTTANNDFGSPTPLPLEGCVAPGDSGGGVFISINSQSYLAGVISFVAATDGSANGSYGDVTGFGPLSSVAPWLNAHVPEPSTYALFLTGGLTWGLGRLRRRARCRR
jgi:hypothetical protein